VIKFGIGGLQEMIHGGFGFKSYRCDGALPLHPFLQEIVYFKEPPLHYAGETEETQKENWRGG
jgi:hypothetical protein